MLNFMREFWEDTKAVYLPLLGALIKAVIFAPKWAMSGLLAMIIVLDEWAESLMER